MDKTINIGVVCLARKTYDFEAAFEIYQEKIKDMKIIEDVNWCYVEELVIEVSQAREAADYFKKMNLDGMVIITGTFHLGHLALVLKKELDIPTQLWAFPELPYDGGKIRLNSICGLNLNASNLYKAGYDDVTCNIHGEIDEDWLAAIRMSTALKKSHIGLVGYRADGFFNLDVEDLSIYRNTGILIDHFELADIFNQPENIVDIENYQQFISENFDCTEMTEHQIKLVATLCGKFKLFMEINMLDAIAVRCWPEFAAAYGCSPCAAMSILQSQNIIIGCEGDIEGTMSMLITSTLNAGTPFLADLSQVDLSDDTALLWHCGVAPITLWDGKSVPSLDTYFAGGKGVTVGFVLKEGPLSLVRIDTARGKTRLFYKEGVAVEMKKQLTGTYAKVKFDETISQLLDSVVSTGVAHHLALVYTQRRRAFEIFAKIMRFELID